MTYLSSELTTVSTRPGNFKISEYGNFQNGLPRLKIELFMKCDSWNVIHYPTTVEKVKSKSFSFFEI